MTSRCFQCGSIVASKEDLDLNIPFATGNIIRCQELVNSNEPPTDVELTFMRPFVSKMAARLTCIDDEIFRLRDRLEQLATDRANLKDYHARYAAVVSPLRRMPSELLLEIFSWTVPSVDETAGNVSDMQQSPWVLARVSSHWRRVALSAPALWSLIDIDYKINLFGGYAVSFAMIRAQVERAQNLRIYFHASESGDAASDEVQLFMFLCQHSARWVDLNLHLFTEALVPHLVALRGRLPSLRRLWIDWVTGSNGMGVRSIKCFQTAPALVDVGVTDFSRRICILFPAHNLTSYRVDAPWAVHEDVLKSAPKLIEARIVIPFGVKAWPAPGGKAIDMPHLRRLFVSEMEVLTYLRASKLSEIAIAVGHGKDLIQVLDEFLLRSSCAPRRFYLEGMLDADVTANILKKYPFITSIVLIFFDPELADEDGLSDALEAHLTMLTHGKVPAFPHLNEIYFGARNGFPVDYPLFLKMLQSRRSPPYTLKSAALLTSWVSNPDAVTLAGLNELTQDGLNLLIETGPTSYIDADRHMDSWAYVTPSPWI